MSALASSSSAALRPTLATPSAAPLSPSPSIRTVSSPLILPRPGSFPGAARTSVAFRAVGKNNENGSWHPSLAPHRPSPAPPLPRRSRWRRYARAHGHSLCLVPPPPSSRLPLPPPVPSSPGPPPCPLPPPPSSPRSRCLSIQEKTEICRKKKSAPRSLHDRHRVPAARDRADRSKRHRREHGVSQW